MESAIAQLTGEPLARFSAVQTGTGIVRVMIADSAIESTLYRMQVDGADAVTTEAGAVADRVVGASSEEWQAVGYTVDSVTRVGPVGTPEAAATAAGLSIAAAVGIGIAIVAAVGTLRDPGEMS